MTAISVSEEGSAVQHLGFLYYSICYLIGLPSLAVAVIAYLKTRSETLKRAIPFLAAVTLQLALSAVNQYMEVNIAGRVTPARLLVLFAYFLAEAATIVVLPRMAHHLAQVPWAHKADRIFTAVSLAMIALLFTPLSFRYHAEQELLRSLAGFYVYRAILTATVVYAVALVLARLPRLRDRLTRVLIWSALAFFAVWLLGFLHCKLMPLFKHVPGDLPLAPLGFFIWNAIFILGVARRHLIAPVGTGGVPLAELCARRGLTDREAEVLVLGCVLLSSSSALAHGRPEVYLDLAADDWTVSAGGAVDESGIDIAAAGFVLPLQAGKFMFKIWGEYSLDFSGSGDPDNWQGRELRLGTPLIHEENLHLHPCLARTSFTRVEAGGTTEFEGALAGFNLMVALSDRMDIEAFLGYSIDGEARRGGLLYDDPEFLDCRLRLAYGLTDRLELAAGYRYQRLTASGLECELGVFSVGLVYGF